MELGRCSTCGGVAVAPKQAVLTLAVRVGGDARDVTLTISDKEGASLGSDERWIFCSGAGFRKRTATNANIRSFILNEQRMTEKLSVFYKKFGRKAGSRGQESITDLLQALGDWNIGVTVLY